MQNQEKPFIQRFENQNPDNSWSFDVVICHSDCRVATDWAKEYFSLGQVTYLNSTFEGLHTYRVTR